MNQEEALLGEAAALGNIGLVLQKQGKYKEALQHLQAALKIHQELGLKEGEANQLVNIGLVLAFQGKLDEALEVLQAAVAIFNDLKSVKRKEIIEAAIDLIKKEKREKNDSRKKQS